MYATGVGLVLKGFEYAENNNMKEPSITKQIKVKTKGLGLFDKLLAKGKEWFEEDDQL